MQHDYNELSLCPEAAAKFIELLTGRPETPMTFHPIDMNKDGARPMKAFHGTLEDCLPHLTRLNLDNFAIYVMVNEGDGQGRKAENVVSIRALFVDCDDGAAKPLEKIQASKIDPDFIVESSEGKFHAYRRVKNFPLDKKLFKGAQLALADMVQSDPSVSDLPRILRLPGFIHRKIKDGISTDPFISRIRQVCHPDRTTDWADLILEYGWSEEKLRNSAPGKTSLSGAQTGPRCRDWQSEAAVRRSDGEGRNSFATQYAGHLISTGLSKDEVTRRMRLWNNNNLEPLDESVCDGIVCRLVEKEEAKSKRFPLTGLGFAERFADCHSARYRYASDQGAWYAWNGCTWERDEHDVLVQSGAQQLARQLLHDAASETDADRRDALVKHNRVLENRSFNRLLKYLGSRSTSAAVQSLWTEQYC